MDNENNTFTIVDDEGNEVVCEILFTFDCNENGKSYIVYTDNALDENGNTKVYASGYDPEGKDTTLLPIETEREWEIVENILNELQEQMMDGEDFD